MTTLAKKGCVADYSYSKELSFAIASDFWVIPYVKTCEVFLCFLAVILLGCIVLTPQWLLCISKLQLVVYYQSCVPIG